MNVVVFYNTRLGSISNDIMYDFLLDLHGNGYQITLMVCKAKHSTCHTNITGAKWKCKACNLITERFISALPKDIRLIRVNPDSDIDLIDLKDKTLSELMNTSLNKVNVGLGPVSTFISYYRDISEIPSNNSLRKLKELFNISISMSDSFRNLLETENFDRLYLFNGRFAESRSLIEVAKQVGLKFTTIEFDTVYGQQDIRSVLFKDCMPHSKEVFKNRFEQILQDVNNLELGKNYYSTREGGNYMGDEFLNYTDNFDESTTEYFLSSVKQGTVIIFFMSSQDEVYALGDEWNNRGIIGDQRQSIDWFVNFVRKNSEFRLIVRAHPNMKNLDFDYVARDLEDLNEERVFYIPPESSVNSYALLREANVVVGVSSSILVEALYNNIPSIQIGDSFFQKLNLCYNPNTIVELEEMLNLVKVGRLTVDEFRFKRVLAYGLTMINSDGNKPKYHDWNKYYRFKPFPYFYLKNSWIKHLLP